MNKLFARGVIYTMIALTVFVVIHRYSINESVAAAALLENDAPSISASQWLNSAALDNNALRGKVFLVEFWTFGCYNCRNVEPYVKQWYQRYRQQGFEVIAVHSPEFAHERDIDRVRAYLQENAIAYPVALDNDFAIWKRFSNRYWPAMYLVDRQGKVRYYHFGEGRYDRTESMIRQLLQE